MRSFLRHNGLTLVLFGMFIVTWGAQAVSGFNEHNDGQRQHGQPASSFGEYLLSGHFWEATAENWESEFLQMALFVILTIFLFQKGSPESKDPDEDDPVNHDPREERNSPRVPWPVRRGGVALWLYSNSLSLCFALLFAASMSIHAIAGAREYNQDQREHGQAETSALGYMATARFWHESFQNWQSEFLSLAAMVYLSVYLRQRGSAESKPVAMPHDEAE